MSEEDEKTVAFLLVGGLALIVLPAMLTKVGATITAWGLAYHVLVPAQQALFTLPGLSAGLDMHRVMILVLALVAAAALATMRRRGKEEAS